MILKMAKMSCGAPGMIAAVVLLQNALLCQPASFASGSSTVPTKNNIWSAKEEDLRDSFKNGLKNAGANNNNEIKELEDQINEAAERIKGKKSAKAITEDFFPEKDGGVKKWAITLIPATLEDPFAETIVPIHEQGHSELDRKSVEEVNSWFARPRRRVPTFEELRFLLRCYEDQANKTFHDEFGAPVGETIGKMRKRRLFPLDPDDVRTFKDESVVKSGIEGSLELHECLQQLGFL